MFLTDAPWCEIRPSHASSKFVSTQFAPAKKKEKWEPGCSVKSRNEPRNLMLVFVHIMHNTRYQESIVLGSINTLLPVYYKFKTVFGISWYFDQHLAVSIIIIMCKNSRQHDM